jgi:hypothetical protein
MFTSVPSPSLDCHLPRWQYYELRIDTKHVRPSNEAYFRRGKRAPSGKLPVSVHFFHISFFLPSLPTVFRHHTAEDFIFNFYSKIPYSKGENNPELCMKSCLFGAGGSVGSVYMLHCWVTLLLKKKLNHGSRVSFGEVLQLLRIFTSSKSHLSI